MGFGLFPLTDLFNTLLDVYVFSIFFSAGIFEGLQILERLTNALPSAGLRARNSFLHSFYLFYLASLPFAARAKPTCVPL